MAQIQLALMAIPWGISASLWPSFVPTVPTATADYYITIIGDLGWEVTQCEVGGWNVVSVVPFFGVVLTHQALCKLQTELLERLLCYTGEVRVEDVCISNSSLKYEPKYIAVKLATFQFHMVVLTQLVIAIYPSHVGLIKCHRCWAWNINSTPIMFSSLHYIYILVLRLSIALVDKTVTTLLSRRRNATIPSRCTICESPLYTEYNEKSIQCTHNTCTYVLLSFVPTYTCTCDSGWYKGK